MKKKKLTHSWKAPLKDTSTSKAQFKDTSATTFLVLLLVADCAFIFLYFLTLTPLVNNPFFYLHLDLGYPEIYQYIKELWIVGLLLSILIKTRTIGYSVWALLFLYLLLDDSLQLHETYGEHIATRLDLTPFLGLRAKDFGELAVTAMAAALFLISLILFYVRGSGAFRQATRHFLFLLFALAVCGIFFDMLHIVITMGRGVKFLFVVLEDGGEMIVMSFIAWYAFLLNVGNGKIGQS